MTREGKRYLTRVKRHLVCRRAELLPQAARLVEDFCQENPDSADRAALVAAFGPADLFAAEMLAGLDPGEVSAARKRRKRLCGTLAAGLVLVLALVSVFWFLEYLRSMDVNRYVYIVQGTPRILTEEEWKASFEGAPESPPVYATQPPCDP